MQLIDNQFVAAESNIAEWLSEPNERKAALEKIKKSVKLMQQDSQLQWILDNHRDAYCEWPISHRTTNSDGKAEIVNMIIDRSFIDKDGTRWIIDYKTGEHLGADLEGFFASEQSRYKPQLDKYENALKDIESRSIKKALYYPLHQKLVEVA